MSATQHLNYCRQLVAQCRESIGNNLGDERDRLHSELVLQMDSLAEKFMMPMDCNFFDDPLLRGIDSSLPLHLPFKAIAIEYQTSIEKFPKCIVFAIDRPDSIDCIDFRYSSRVRRWLCIGGSVQIPKQGVFSDCKVHDGIKWDESSREDAIQHMGPFRAVLMLLNALACSNVNIEKSEPRKHAKVVKSALPFDAYHVLKVDVQERNSTDRIGSGSHRSPREHLRRGHIRQIGDGKRIWINAAIVGAGKGAGRIEKSYSICKGR